MQRWVKALIFQAREALVRSRQARDRPCVEIRERLATLPGSVLPRSMTRAHIDRCSSCAAFEHEVVRDIESVAFAQSTSADTPAERTRASARTWMVLLRDRPEMFLLLIEQWARAARDPEHRAAFVEHFRLFREATARWVVAEAERGGYELPLPPDQIALGANALLFGVALEYLADPDSVPSDGLATLELALLRGLRRKSGDD